MSNAIIVVLFVSTALIVLGSLSVVEGLTSVIIPLPSFTNEIFLRDIGNTNPQTATLSLDGMFAQGQDVTIIVTEEDSDLDPTNIDIVMVTLQTPSGFNKIVLLQETGINVGIFSGTATLDNVLPGEFLTAIYTPNPPGVGRLFAQIGTLAGVGTATLKDSNFRNKPSIDEFSATCPFDLYVHTVDVSFAGVTPDPDTMTVTISYANTVLGDNSVVNGKDFEDLEVVYRTTETSSFKSLTTNLDGHDETAKTITSQLPPQIFSTTFPAGSNGNGQYALGINLGSCIGGGGGGLRPPVIVNALTQIMPSPVGGTIIPIDTTALLVAGLQINAIWMIPAILGVAGAGIAIYKLKRK